MAEIHETPKTLENERRISQLYLKYHPCVCLEKMSIREKFDYAMHWGDRHIIGYMEVKSRQTVRQKRWPYYHLEAEKFMKGMEYARYNHAVLVVAFSDNCGVFTFDVDDRFEQMWGGREDRPDQNDKQPYFRIPIERFNYFGETIRFVDG